MRRLTISIGEDLERALAEAPRLLDLASTSSASERLRAYARRGYEVVLDDELRRQRLDAYRQWADEPDLTTSGVAAFRRAADRGIYSDETS